MANQKDNSADTKKAFIRILSYTKPHRIWLAFTIFASVVGGVSSILLAKGMKGMADSAISRDLTSLKNFLYLMAAAFLMEMFTAFLRTYSSGRFAEYSVFDMRQKSDEHICSLPVSYLENHSTGDLISRLNNDLNSTKGFLEGTLRDIIAGSIICSVSIICLLVINWKMTLLTGIMVPAFTVISAKLSKPIEGYAKKRQEAAGRVTAVLQDSIFGITEIKSFVLERLTREKFSKNIDESVQCSLKIFGVEVTFLYPVQGLTYLMPFISTLLLGGYFIVHKQLTYGELLAFVALYDNVVDPISYIPSLIASARSSMAAAGRIFEIWDVKPERDGGETNTADSSSVITFDNVKFSYDGSNLLFNGLSFDIKKGETVALVGSSGCGKSTVLKLITDFYSPNDGTIRIFGHDISKWNLDKMRGLIAEVSQDVYLFPDTIYQNILYGKPDAPAVKVEEVSKAANIYDFIQGLPEQYYTLVGERGVKLSGGQKQRVAIARALLKNAPVLLLDEATSALDAESEYEVQIALEELMKNRTTLVIAHRLSTIRNADRILVMNEGKIVESGTHEELLKKGNIYSKLYYKQYSMEQSDDLTAAEGQV